MTKYEPSLLIELLPGLAAEILRGLEEPEFAPQGTDLEALRGQVSRIEVVSLCGCDDDFRGSFHTKVRGVTSQSSPSGNGTVVFGGVLNLDIDDGCIAYVEVIDWPDDRATLRRHFGKDV